MNAHSELLNFLENKLSNRDYVEAEAMVKSLPDYDKDDSSNQPRPAMDRKPYGFAMDSRRPGRIIADREAAIQECERTVPRSRLMACDSAANVFRTALSELNVDHLTLDDAALPAMYRVSIRGGRYNPAPTAAETAAFNKRFPDAGRIKSI